MILLDMLFVAIVLSMFAFLYRGKCWKCCKDLKPKVDLDNRSYPMYYTKGLVRLKVCKSCKGD